jgi:branched-chain amino acid transport system substrate-binding protein
VNSGLKNYRSLSKQRKNNTERRNSLKKVLFISLAVVLALSIGLIGCEGEPTPKVLLGATLPLQGNFAGFGQQGWGMQKAVDDWNDTYGGVSIGGETWEVELIIKDNQSNFDLVYPQSVDLVVDDEVHALLSPNAPVDLHAPTSEVASEYSVPQIICGGPFEPWYFGVWNGSAPDYTWFSGFSIGAPQPAPRDVPGYTMVDTWFMFMDDPVVQALNVTNGIVGVFASSDADGTGWYATFPGILTDAGYTVDDTDGLFDIDTPVYTTIVEGWIAGNVSILWGNCPGPHFGQLITECNTQGFQPEICLAARAALFPSDVEAWGTAPPFGYGVGTEIWWSPNYQVADGFEGIGGRTATSLADEFTAQSGNPPLNRSIGTGYLAAQVMLQAIEDAGSVDGDDINDALAAINMDTICGEVYFVSETHFSPQPLSFGQWFYEGGEFDLRIVASALSFIPEEDEPIFPYPEWPE